MDRQAGFLLALLFLANFLTIEAGDTSIPATGQLVNVITVNPGSPWAATCKDLDGSQKVADWTRDDVTLATEIRNQELTVNSTSNASTISATSATKQHEGIYRCSPESHDVHLVRVKSESTPTLQAQTKAASNILANTTGNPLFDNLFALAVNATLTCKNTTSNLPVQWKKNNEIVTENTEHYELQEGGKTIFFKKAVKTLLGNYSCMQGEPARILENYEVIEIPTVTLPPNSSVVEGEKFTLTASFSDTKYKPKDLNVSISWTVNSTTYTEGKGRVVLSADETTGIANWKITILDMTMNDHSQIGGPIICNAKYLHLPGQPADEGATYLVVKDKLAALWPFLGICLEVVVLCAIILVYEKKRNKAELEESDTDQSPDTKPAANKDSEVRHRK